MNTTFNRFLQKSYKNIVKRFELETIPPAPTDISEIGFNRMFWSFTRSSFLTHSCVVVEIRYIFFSGNMYQNVCREQIVWTGGLFHFVLSNSDLNSV